jgi:hypothetical protein
VTRRNTALVLTGALQYTSVKPSAVMARNRGILMQRFISTSRHRAGADGVYATGPERLAAAFRLRGFEVRVLPLPDDARANLPDAIVLLRKGREQVLVHAYARVQGALPQGTVRQLALDAFEANAARGMLIGAAGFTVAAYQAALHHQQLELIDEAGLGALLDAQAPVQTQPAAALSPQSLRQATRPAWPLRAVIGMGGMAMAVVMVFASMPSLQGQLLGLLRPASNAPSFTQASAEPWHAPSQARSGELSLSAAVESGSVARQAASVTASGLPDNFNQALSAPHL